MAVISFPRPGACGGLGIGRLRSAALLWIGSAATALGCPCPPYDLPAIVGAADVIVVGRVVSATADTAGAVRNQDGGWQGGETFQLRATLEVDQRLKGEAPEVLEVVSPIGPCGFVFAVGKTYLVSAAGSGPTVRTDSCRGNVTGSAMAARIDTVRDLLRPRAPTQ